MTADMTLAEARERVEKIRQGAGDNEVMHVDEDELHQDVLRYFAEVAPAELAELAKIALSTLEIEFSRWYA